MKLNRRLVALGFSAATLIFTVSACTNGSVAPSTITTNLQEAASDISLVATGLQNELSPILTQTNVSPDVQTQLQSALNTIAADASIIEGNVNSGTPGTGSTASQVAATVEKIGNTIIPLVPGGAVFLPAVEAAESLIPSALATFGVTLASSKAPKYDPATARSILKAAAVKKH